MIQSGFSKWRKRKGKGKERKGGERKGRGGDGRKVRQKGQELGKNKREGPKQPCPICCSIIKDKGIYMNVDLLRSPRVK